MKKIDRWDICLDIMIALFVVVAVFSYVSYVNHLNQYIKEQQEYIKEQQEYVQKLKEGIFVVQLPTGTYEVINSGKIRSGDVVYALVDKGNRNDTVFFYHPSQKIEWWKWTSGATVIVQTDGSVSVIPRYPANAPNQKA